MGREGTISVASSAKLGIKPEEAPPLYSQWSLSFTKPDTCSAEALSFPTILFRPASLVSCPWYFMSAPAFSMASWRPEASVTISCAAGISCLWPAVKSMGSNPVCPCPSGRGSSGAPGVFSVKAALSICSIVLGNKVFHLAWSKS